MSFLVPEDEHQNPEPQQQQTCYGRLKANPKARARRGRVKFFDSADWATGKQTNEPTQQAFPYVVEEEQMPDYDESPFSC